MKKLLFGSNPKIFLLFVLHSLAVIATAVLVYIFIEYVRLGETGEAGPIGNYIHDFSEKSLRFFAKYWPQISDPIISRALGVIIPTALIMFPLNLNVSRVLYRSIGELTRAIDLLGEGEFSVRLNPKKAGLFVHTYQRFNKAASELSNIKNLKDDFVNNYSHEFKTPINSINGFSKLLLEQKDLSDDEKEQYLKIIYNESMRLANMANSTIILSKLNNQLIVTDKTEYSLDEQLRNCAILLMKSCNEKMINISCELEDISYYGNAELMERLWLNLIGNSVKYTPKGGEITITASSKGGYITVHVIDNGIGMSKETVDRIFEQYYQGEQAHSGDGLGLGMAICKRIVELCEGRIVVKSVENEGTDVTVIIPV